MIEQVLRAYVVAGESGTWHEQLGSCNFALNSAKQASTRVSPFELVLGAPVREPLDHVQGIRDVPVATELAQWVRTLVGKARESLTCV